MTRRAQIEAMLADDPTDTFLRYSLAMELRSEGEHEASLQRLTELMNDATPCVPAFFMAGQQLAELGRLEEACEHLRRGIDEAGRQGDSHAEAEMNDLLSQLEDADL